LRLALAADQRAHPDGSVEAVRLLYMLCRAQTSSGRFDDAERSLEDADAMRRRHAAGDAALQADLLDLRGALLANKGEFAAALPVFEEARTLVRARNLGPEAGARASANLGFTFASLGRHREAVPLYTEAVEGSRAAFGPDAAEVAEKLSPYASSLWFAGERERALRVYEEALAIRGKTHGTEHPEYAWTLANYADSLIWLGQYAKAEPMAREILALRGRTLPDTHAMVPFAMALLGRSLGPLGQLDEAERWLRESLALRERTSPAGHWTLASSRSVLGAHLTLAKRWPEAESLLLEAERDLVAALGESGPAVVDTRRRLVDLYAAWGRPAEQQRWRDRLPTPAP
jgi:tetratricopeptide (TPR) repeat protein